MNYLKNYLLILLVVVISGFGDAKAVSPVDNEPVPASDRVIIAYVFRNQQALPDPTLMTHINYAFGHVNNTFDGVRINSEERLRELVKLKQINPDLKILISIGGWGSGRFSEMAMDSTLRAKFVADCIRVYKEFGLDGVDLDWEYPTSGMAKISAHPDDTKNFTLLMKELREALGEGPLLTLATAANAKYIDFKGIDPYIDFVNVMTYDMGVPPKHHSALFRSPIASYITGDEAMKAHEAAGVPKHKLVMGMPFYGKTAKDFPRVKWHEYNTLPADEYTEQWDDVAKVPYLVDSEGKLVSGFENPRSLAIKCEYLIKNGYKGAMYWEYFEDNESRDLSRAVFNGVFEKK